MKPGFKLSEHIPLLFGILGSVASILTAIYIIGIRNRMEKMETVAQTVTLPRAQAAKREQYFEIQLQGSQASIEGVPVSDAEILESLRKQKGNRILLRATQNTPYSVVKRIMQLASSSGVTDVTFAVESPR